MVTSSPFVSAQAVSATSGCHWRSLLGFSVSHQMRINEIDLGNPEAADSSCHDDAATRFSFLRNEDGSCPQQLSLFGCPFVLFWPVVVGRLPAFVRIITIHSLEIFKRVRTKVLFKYGSVGADDERLYSAHPILGRSRGQREPADHSSIDDKIHLSQGRSGSLAFQNLEVVAVKWLTLFRVALFKRSRYSLADRTAPCPVYILPG